MNAPPAATRVHCIAASPAGTREIDRAEAAARVHGTFPSADPSEFVWIDLTHPTEAEARYLRDQLGMHPLAVEDCLRGRQRPKVDTYPGYSFVVFYASHINRGRGRMALNEIHLFLARGFLITVHDQEIPEVREVAAACAETPERWKQPAAVAHAVLDAITDRYFPLVEHFSSRIEGFEEEVFSDRPVISMERIAHLRRELIHFRRILGPERDVLSALVRRDLPLVQPELIPYFADVHDHVLRATEELDTLRDLLAGLIELQASTAAKQLNQTMQTLTSWSIILMSITLIAGVYGMNFEFMPELTWAWGYFAALGVMACVGALLYRYFRRMHWL